MSTISHPNLQRIYIWGNNTISGDLGGLSNSVTYIDLRGYNEVTGDIATLPPNLIVLIVHGLSPGGNTLYGNINTFNYSTLNTIQILGNNTISGNTSSLNLQSNATFDIDGNNTITGNISTLNVPNTSNLITIKGDNTIFGNIQNLPTNATNIEIDGNNVISGDLSLVHLTISRLVIQGNNTITTFSNSSRIFTTGLNTIITTSNLVGVGFDSSNIDRLLTSYANSTWGGPNRQLQLRGTSTPKYTNTTSYNILAGPTKQVGITLL
jgi:cytoskeletal protein CcmA (bactofilin family)